MKLLFNRNGEGSAEMKQLLGWLNTTLRYKNIESDIDLETPRLIEFISQPVYDHIYNLYKTNSNEEVDKDLIKYAQLYISCMAYLSYASNNDLSHGSTGRKQYKAIMKVLLGNGK
ncbi:hypothetical protein JCM19294_1124 [Nonlabens tegetincola]|uniref:Uncharacterized protein n=1 Tax=Nonlabens tegetincola TaxID=323273 RepID=A0A090Q1A4_9FLAO|nr:hypothetical protein [Nonlabens tegetincola]GAK96815.1 hypothetical protein JCM19294_1124 [Nonlabens tegetincola]